MKRTGGVKGTEEKVVGEEWSGKQNKEGDEGKVKAYNKKEGGKGMTENRGRNIKCMAFVFLRE